MMRYGTVPGVNKQVSRIGQGCMMLAEGEGQPESNKILDAALASGVNLFDHSHVYGGGVCERAFGVWLAERGNREELVILDKGCHPKGSELRVTPEHIVEDVAGSLGRLGIDTIDLWLFHRDNPAQPVGPLIETLNELRSAGKIRAFGGSNWSHTRIAEANEYAEAHGLSPMVASSPNYSLAEQVDSPWGPDCVTISGRENLEARIWYEQSGMPVFAWSSLARGFLSGRIRRENVEQVKDDFEEHTIRCYVTEDNLERVERAALLATERGMTIPQIALAYVLHQPMNVFALIGARNRDEAEANAAALDAKLTQAELDWLDLHSDTR
jgi:aryl-alcohol dehydrogenase-like predicted oxidoreductase